MSNMLKFAGMGRVSGRILLQSKTNLTWKPSDNPMLLSQSAPLRKIGGSDACRCQACGEINDSIWAAVRNSKKIYLPIQPTEKEIQLRNEMNPVSVRSVKCFPEAPKFDAEDVRQIKEIHLKRTQQKYKRVSPEFLKLLEPYEKFVEHPSLIDAKSSKSAIVRSFSDENEKDSGNWKCMRGFLRIMSQYKNLDKNDRAITSSADKSHLGRNNKNKFQTGKEAKSQTLQFKNMDEFKPPKNTEVDEVEDKDTILCCGRGARVLLPGNSKGQTAKPVRTVNDINQKTSIARIGFALNQNYGPADKNDIKTKKSNLHVSGARILKYGDFVKDKMENQRDVEKVDILRILSFPDDVDGDDNSFYDDANMMTTSPARVQYLFQRYEPRRDPVEKRKMMPAKPPKFQKADDVDQINKRPKSRKRIRRETMTIEEGIPGPEYILGKNEPMTTQQAKKKKP